MNVVQIGCNDCKDHVFSFVNENANEIKNLVLVDALPKCIEEAKKQYLFLGERATAINAAIGVKNGLIDFFYPTQDEQSEHASLNFRHLVEHNHELITKKTMICLDIDEFVEGLPFREIDYFFLDVEGMDVEVLLKMDIEKYSPKFIRFEYCHSDGPFFVGKNFIKIVRKPKHLNYQLRLDGDRDMIAQKEQKV